MVANKTKCNFLSMMVTEIMSMKHMNTYVKKQKHKLENWAFLKKLWVIEINYRHIW